jgi:hypothetical protein
MRERGETSAARVLGAQRPMREPRKGRVGAPPNTGRCDVNDWHDVVKAIQRQGKDACAMRANWFRDCVAAELRSRGWETRFEVLCGKSLVELVATHGDFVCAVQLDRAAPRLRSVRALQRAEANACIVGLREGFARLLLPAGIDAVVCAWPPRLYTPEQPRGYAPRPARW